MTTLTLPDSADLTQLSGEELQELLVLLQKRDLDAKRNKLRTYRPYRKQLDFHIAGAHFRERLFMAGNQLGKTLGGAAEVAMHATGLYPDWWEGRRFGYGTRILCGSESAELTRKSCQRLLLGPPELKEEWGTGFIPHHTFKDHSLKQGVPDAVASIVVKHASGDNSIIQFLSYDQGRTKWQADTVDVVWFDEEPPLPVYSEGLTRTNATGGLVQVTFTPLLGVSEVVKRFIIDKAEGTHITSMTIDDAEHYTAEERERIVAGYPEHEREARAKGIPILGSGRVFPVTESGISVTPFAIPAHWPRLVGLDIGVDHPTAAAWTAYDRDTDTLYVYDTYRLKGASVATHATTIRSRAPWIPVAWPHDALQRDKGSGAQIARQYKDAGVNMLPERATFDDGTNGLEAGVAEMLTRMQSGRLRVFNHLAEWFEEFRLYHRKDGMIVRVGDDILSATRYAMMMKRKAKTQAEVDGFGRAPAPPTIGYGVLDVEMGY